MSPLSDGLPAEARKQCLIWELLPGCVVRLEIKFSEKSKHKFLVLVAKDDPEYWMFIINSDIHPFVQEKQHLLQCQVKMDAAEHPFLQHNSHLACHQILKLRREEVIQALMRDTSGLRGISRRLCGNRLSAETFLYTTCDTHTKETESEKC